MKKIAITGNIAAGKSAVENIIKQYGYKVLDADNICHTALEDDYSIISKVKNLFKKFDIIDNDLKLDRKKIANIIFYNDEYKSKLENILHPYVRKQIIEFCNINKDEIMLFVSVPLLFETNMQNIFDKIILVTAEEQIRLNRIISRNHCTKEQALARINAQLKQDEKIKLSDFVINNNDSLESLEFKTKKVISDLLYLFK